MRGMEFLLLASANLATGINCVLSAIDVTFVFLACRDTCTRTECLDCLSMTAAVALRATAVVIEACYSTNYCQWSYSHILSLC